MNVQFRDKKNVPNTASFFSKDKTKCFVQEIFYFIAYYSHLKNASSPLI